MSLFPPLSAAVVADPLLEARSANSENGKSKWPLRLVSKLKEVVPGGGVNWNLPGPQRCKTLFTMSRTARLPAKLRRPRRAGTSDPGKTGALKLAALSLPLRSRMAPGTVTWSTAV